MNQTIEGSKKMAVLVGGDTIVLDVATIEMPPEHARSMESVLDSIEVGDFQVIKMGDCKEKDVLSKEQITLLKKNRAARKTEKALARLAAKQRE